jgi:hypothetical protein
MVDETIIHHYGALGETRSKSDNSLTSARKVSGEQSVSHLRRAAKRAVPLTFSAQVYENNN